MHPLNINQIHKFEKFAQSICRQLPELIEYLEDYGLEREMKFIDRANALSTGWN